MDRDHRLGASGSDGRIVRQQLSATSGRDTSAEVRIDERACRAAPRRPEAGGLRLHHGTAYLTLLTEFDINFYLTQKPTEFKVAIGIAVVVGIGLAVVLLRLATSWFYALPLVVFEGVSPKQALQVSRDRVRGHRVIVVAWMTHLGRVMR